MLIVLRHAEPRHSESDPPLTSLGHRMARDAGEWVASLLPAASPVDVRVTPSRRTQETAHGIEAWLGERAHVRQIEQLPEDTLSLSILADKLAGGVPGLPRPDLGPTVLIGHHTSLVGLLRDLPAVSLDPRRYCAALALERAAEEDCGWRVVGHLPGWRS